MIKSLSVFKKMSFLLVLAVLLTVVWIPVVPASAATPKGAHQPFLHGYSPAQLSNWSPATDTYAKYLRSRVPMATRIAPFVSTQAHPALSSGPKLISLMGDYDNSYADGFKYNDVYAKYAYNFWQYTDLYSAWHGMYTDGTTNFGVINPPNPAYTDAAHKNGVLSLGCWFWPRSGVNFDDFLVQNGDGSFPIADKMIQLAQYYGFDGYFINQEGSITSTQASKLMAFLTYMRKVAPTNFHFQWYDALTTSGSISYQNEFNSTNAPWLKNGSTNVCNSIFLNYWWNSSKLSNSNSYATSLGLNPLATVFAGTEQESGGYNSGYDPKNIFPDGGSPKTGWALFGPDFVWRMYSGKDDPSKQEEVYKRERINFSGPNQNPAISGRNSAYTAWDGVAHFIAERSVIGSYPFMTRFNTGHGKSFYLDGSLASTKEWCNLTAQDILPTWQWWTSSPGTPLSVAFDYSTAYNGGSSLKVSGALSSSNPTNLRLYKTKLNVSSGVQLSLKYKTGTANAASNMKVGLLFEDNPSNFVYFDVGNTTSADWNTKNIDLSSYAGKTIATVGLRFESSSSINYSANIGELALTSGTSSAPSVPSGFKIDQSYIGTSNAELFLSWNFNTTGVGYFDIYRVRPDSTREYLGRTYDEAYYVKSLDKIGSETSTVLELVAVGLHGIKSSAATTTINWGGTAKVATPTFSPAGGTYTSTQSVTLSCATSGATIRYTTNGSTPSASSPAYSSPITVSSTTTIKAYAVNAGMTDSDVASATYTIGTSSGTKVEAENYSNKNGITVYNDMASSGGKYVGNYASTYWSEYNNVNIPSNGTYKLSFRVASMNAGTKFQLKEGTVVLCTVDVGNTESWTTWKTVTQNVTLTSGVKTWRFVPAGTGKYPNLDYFEFVAN